ncbi:N-acetylmuramoyl-L-alanine amidase [Kribbella sp. CA-294648]|uniref:N-acetylmuramoyl-L-alanine amidase n=1 Tax=Kribbella sp. CA-294648 TaxID=3239948 RepID=UPI003D934B21
MVPVADAPPTLVEYAHEGQEIMEPGFPLDYVGIAWTGAGVAGRVRFGPDGQWGEWTEIPNGEQLRKGRFLSVVPARKAASVNVEFLASVSEVQVVALNTTEGASGAAALEDHGAGRGSPGIPAGGYHVTRAGWGADESLRSRDAKSLRGASPAQVITLHQVAAGCDGLESAALMRAIYFLHTDCERLGDIGYHWLIDGDGVVYVGSNGGLLTSAAGADRRLVESAAHLAGFNAGNIGIALMTDCEVGFTPEVMRQSLVRLLADLVETYGLDPQGQTWYVNPVTGASQFVPVISSHREWTGSTCLGAAIDVAMPAIRASVVSHLTPRDGIAQPCDTP